MERRKFTREFKLEAVKLIKDRGVSYARAAGQSVKATSREAVARPATALTDWRWSGRFAPGGRAWYWSKVERMALGSLISLMT
jgi:hypothetical protein